jgi:hypothetical protein
MNKKPIIIFFIVLFLSASCQRKESEISAKRAAENLGKIEVNEERIKEMTGISCRILKSETLGYMPLHKFFWISVPEKLDQEKIERLAMAIINETIHTRPRTYHSFTIHFFSEKELGPSIEASESFARATFLPEGDWAKVGRVPIDDYKNYQLRCTFLARKTLR